MVLAGKATVKVMPAKDCGRDGKPLLKMPDGADADPSPFAFFTFGANDQDFYDQTRATLQNLRIDAGGARPCVAAEGARKVVLKGVELVNCYGSYKGAALYGSDTKFVVTNGLFLNSRTANAPDGEVSFPGAGGALAVDNYQRTGWLARVAGTRFEANSHESAAGAFLVSTYLAGASVKVEFSRCAFEGNSAGSSCAVGAVYRADRFMTGAKLSAGKMALSVKRSSFAGAPPPPPGKRACCSLRFALCMFALMCVFLCACCACILLATIFNINTPPLPPLLRHFLPSPPPNHNATTDNGVGDPPSDASQLLCGAYQQPVLGAGDPQELAFTRPTALTLSGATGAGARVPAADLPAELPPLAVEGDGGVEFVVGIAAPAR